MRLVVLILLLISCSKQESIDLDLSELNKIEINKYNQTLILEDKWYVENNNFPADNRKIRHLLYFLSNLTIIEVINSNDFEKFGLTEVKLGGKDEMSIFIGNVFIPMDATYIGYNGKIYLVDSLYSLSNKWIDEVLFEFDEFKYLKISHYKDSEIEIYKKKGKFKLKGYEERDFKLANLFKFFEHLTIEDIRPISKLSKNIYVKAITTNDVIINIVLSKKDRWFAKFKLNYSGDDLKVKEYVESKKYIEDWMYIIPSYKASYFNQLKDNFIR